MLMIPCTAVLSLTAFAVAVPPKDSPFAKKPKMPPISWLVAAFAASIAICLKIFAKYLSTAKLPFSNISSSAAPPMLPMPVNASVNRAVSYTHLDVYKRQG